MTATPTAPPPGARAATSASRQAVLDALATVPGLVPVATMPDTPMAGAAWPVWAESRIRAGKLARPLTHTYEVRVVLPAGYLPETVDAADGVLEALCAALDGVGALDVANPVQIQFDNAQSMPGINARVTVAVC
jgi:hypothetical protein